jgi:hypothetical protein
MEFPHLMFLPEKAGVFAVDSMFRLGETFHISRPLNALAPPKLVDREILHRIRRGHIRESAP